MSMEDLISQLQDKIDLGNPEQVELYDDVITEQNLDEKKSKMMKLLMILLKTHSSTDTKQDTITDRLLSHIQNFVALLESFSCDSNITKLFTTTSASPSLIPRSFFQNIAQTFQTFLKIQRITGKSTLSNLTIDDITGKISEVKLLKTTAESSTNIEQIRTMYLEMCSLFELSCLFNYKIIQNQNTLIEEKDIMSGSISKYKEEIKKLKKLCSNQQHSINKYEGKETLMDTNITKYETKLQEFEQQFYILKKENQNIMSQLNNEKEESRNIEKIKKQNSKLISRNEYLQKQMNELVTQNNKLVEKQKNLEICSRNDEIKSQLNSIEILKNKLDKAKQKMSNFNETFQSMEAQIKLLNEENTKLKTKLSPKLNIHDSDFNAKINDLNTIIQDLKEKLSILQKEKHDLQIKAIDQDKNQEIILKNKEMQREITELQNLLIHLRKENKALKGKSNISQDSLDSFEELKQKYSESTTTQYQMQLQLQQKQKEINITNQELIYLKDVVSEKDEIISELNKEIENLNQLISGLQEKEKELISKMNDSQTILQSQIQKSNDSKLLQSQNLDYQILLQQKDEQIKDLKSQINTSLVHDSIKKINEQNEVIKKLNLQLRNMEHINGQKESEIRKLKEAKDQIVQDSLQIAEAFQELQSKQASNSKEMSAQMIGLMLADALSQPLSIINLKNEMYRLIDIVRSNQTKLAALASTPNNKQSKSFLPNVDELDREIANLKLNISTS